VYILICIITIVRLAPTGGETAAAPEGVRS
jgi:hypothetical protein